MMTLRKKRKLYTIQQEEVLLSTEITGGLNESDDRTYVYIKGEESQGMH